MANDWRDCDGQTVRMKRDAKGEFPKVYIRYRNGDIVGPVEADKRRWKLMPGVSPYEFDIVAWRLA